MENATVESVATVLDRAVTENGVRLMDLLNDSPVLLVFLRHAGCTFCREAASDISKVQRDIEDSGTRIVLVHMGDRPAIDRVIRRYGLSGLERIRDASQSLYRAFGLKNGSWRQLLGWKVWARGFSSAILRGHGLRLPAADATQMPGVFLIERGVVVRSFRHRSAADRPDYGALRGDPGSPPAH